MENFNMSKHTSFYAVGLSYKKADAAIRGKFSLDAKAKSTLLMQAEATLKYEDREELYRKLTEESEITSLSFAKSWYL